MRRSLPPCFTEPGGEDAPAMGGMTSVSAFSRFVEELRRRRVLRVGGIYAVAVFGVFQTVDVVFPALGLPELTVTLTVVIGLLAFPVALLLAWAVDITPEGLKRAQPPDSADASKPHGRIRNPWLAVVTGVAAIGLLGLGAWQVLRRQEVRIVAATLDAKRVAVLPFRVGGASADLGYLREGMVDLLATTVFADDGTHAVDAPGLLRAWRAAVSNEAEDLPVDSARAVARELGAGWLLIGAVVGAPDRLTLNAELVEVASGRVRARPRLDGSINGLTTLVDGIAGQVLARIAGETEERTSLIARVPLPAVRAYLTGRSEARHGRYQEAFDSHAEALRMDSTFVPAALGMIEAGSWDAGTPDELSRARSIVAGRMDDLPAVERLEALAFIGPRYPAPTAGAEMFDYAVRLRQAAPDRPESALRLAEMLFHQGAALGIADAGDRAYALFSAILENDSADAGALEHLAELSLERGDTAAVRRLTEHFRSLDPDGFAGHVMEWYRLIAIADPDTLTAFRARLPDLSFATLWGVTVVGQLVATDMETVDRAAEALERRNTPIAYWAAANVAAARGRPDHAGDMLEAGRTVSTGSADPFTALAIGWVLYGDGDPDAAALAAARLGSTEGDDGAADPIGLCALEQWRLWNGETSRAAATLEALSAVPVDTLNWSHLAVGFCGLIVETIHAHVIGRADADSLLARLDSAAATEPAATSQFIVAMANRVVSRILEERGDIPGALRAARRQYDFGRTLPFLAPRLLDQARLAELMGDRNAAIRALRHYIILRSDPEPSRLPDLERARAELARLVGESVG